eukprot:scaffold127376_cov74-Phaeocystis_antarctica.AAC.2
MVPTSVASEVVAAAIGDVADSAVRPGSPWLAERAIHVGTRRCVGRGRIGAAPQVGAVIVRAPESGQQGQPSQSVSQPLACGPERAATTLDVSWVVHGIVVGLDALASRHAGGALWRHRVLRTRRAGSLIDLARAVVERVLGAADDRTSGAPKARRAYLALVFPLLVLVFARLAVRAVFAFWHRGIHADSARLHLCGALCAASPVRADLTVGGALQQWPHSNPPCRTVLRREAAHGAKRPILASDGIEGSSTARIAGRAYRVTRWIRLSSKRVTDNPSSAGEGKVAQVLARLKAVDAAAVLDEGVAAQWCGNAVWSFSTTSPPMTWSAVPWLAVKVVLAMIVEPLVT